MEQILLTIAILTTGIIYGTDVFFAVVGKKASRMSKDSSIADLLGHIHLVADKRIPIIGIASVASTSLSVFLIGINHISGKLTSMSLLFVLIHLILYLTVAKPINKKIAKSVGQRHRIPCYLINHCFIAIDIGNKESLIGTAFH
jgi:hypothetical protein